MNHKKLLNDLADHWGPDSDQFNEVRKLINFKERIDKYLIKVTRELFAPGEVQVKKTPKDKKTLFRNSSLNSYEAARSYLMKNPELVQRYKGADLRHYLQEIEDWSDTSGKMTTELGWMAYLRKFMNDDLDNGSLVKIKKAQKSSTNIPIG